MHWTERYNASSLEMGEDGWRMGVAQDVRLNRSVFLAVRTVHRDERSIVEQWLATRSSFSHEYVADVLDCVFSEDELACIFLMPQQMQQIHANGVNALIERRKVYRQKRQKLRSDMLVP